MRKVEIDEQDHDQDSSNIHYEDDWRNPARAHADLGKLWIGRTMFLIQDDLENYWLSKKQLDSWMPNYAGDVFPFQDPQKLKELHHEYKAMPEEFYVKTGRRVVTPENVDRWLDEVQKAHSHPACHFLELYSGSGRLSLTMATAGLTVGPPIDLRYGWNINCSQHQKKLWRVIEVLKPEVIFASPRCKFYSTTANTMSEEKKLHGRLEDEPGLNFTKKVFQHQAYSGRSFAAEQPWGSTMFRDSPLKPEEIPSCRSKQRCDQCMLGACDEFQQPVQKATALLSDFKWKKTTKRCSGHRGKLHSQLQGKVSGINRTALAAVYPRTMCHEMCKDIIGHLNDNHRLRMPAWPKSLHHVWHSHLYKCERCQLGRQSPPGLEHSLIPGECRHAVYPTADGKRPRKNPGTSANPVADWKKEAKKSPMEDVKLEFPKPMAMSAESRVYWKAVLLQVIQEALAIFSEATDIGKDYQHWVLDQTLLAIIRDLTSKVMYLKGVKVCLRPTTMAAPEPQLSTHTAPLRVQIHGAVKHWIMDELQDLTTCSKRQIEQPVSIDAWQITLFGKELGEGGVHADSVAKSAPRTPNPSTVPKTPNPLTSSPSTPALPSQ